MHAHDHDHDHDHDHPHGHSHDDLLKSKEEAAAFLRYTLEHNAHHDEELSGLVHSLQHLQLTKEADEVEGCIAELLKINARLEAVLAALK
jgi:hypothetical protein